MDLHVSPNITSFVIRFVQAEPLPGTPGERGAAFRGSIRHVQTDEEISFTHWADAVQFIRRFVQLEMEEER